ncbi:hypothetical protein AGLY_012500 [Aphis glycines]|uniref:Uncharacterized protein n=1 Tax=Aphis glycines TaxID=307491 RepID=A0A6G0TAQ2_APHGL|nr:hypothetical protein AGLY_012500 [Aphis glycines]
MARPCATIAYYRVQYTYYTLRASSRCVQIVHFFAVVILHRSEHTVGIGNASCSRVTYIILQNITKTNNKSNLHIYLYTYLIQSSVIQHERNTANNKYRTAIIIQTYVGTIMGRYGHTIAVAAITRVELYLEKQHSATAIAAEYRAVKTSSSKCVSGCAERYSTIRHNIGTYLPNNNNNSSITRSNAATIATDLDTAATASPATGTLTSRRLHTDKTIKCLVLLRCAPLIVIYYNDTYEYTDVLYMCVYCVCISYYYNSLRGLCAFTATIKTMRIIIRIKQ